MFIKIIGFIVFYKYYSLTLVLHFFLLGCIFDLIRFKQAYSESIYPVGDKAYWDIPLDVAKFVCRPPSTRFPSGRRKKKEFQVRGSMENTVPNPNQHPKVTNAADVGSKDTTRVHVLSQLDNKSLLSKLVFI